VITSAGHERGSCGVDRRQASTPIEILSPALDCLIAKLRSELAQFLLVPGRPTHA
jgi:hypothetical protein